MLAKLLHKKTVFGQLILFGLLLVGLVVHYKLFTSFGERPLAWSVYFLSLLCSWTITSTAPLFRSSLVPHFCLFVWYFLFAGLAMNTPVILACFFVQLSLFHLLTPFGRSGANDTIFEGALYISFAVLVYFPAVYFLAFILIFLVVFRTLNLRSSVLMLFGLIFPPLIFGQIFYLTGDLALITHQKWRLPLDVFSFSQEFNLLIIYLFLALIGVVDYYRKFYNQVNKNKRGIFLAMMFGLIGLIFIFSFMGENLDYALFLCFPLTVFIGRFIETKHSATARDIWLWVFLALSVGLFVHRNYF